MADEKTQYQKDLEAVRREALRRMRDCADSQFSAVANTLVSSSEKLDAYEGGGKNRETALSEFQKRLAERQQSGTSGSRTRKSS